MQVTKRVPRVQLVPLWPALIIEDDKLTVGNEVLRDRANLRNEFWKLIAHIASTA